MKRFTAIIILIAIAFASFSQVYLPPEDFSGEDFPPEGWTIENGGDDNTFVEGPMPLTEEPTCTWIETSANMTIDDRIISPEIVLPEGMEAKLYAQLRGSVGWAIEQYWDPDNEVRYFIEVSTDGGDNWTAVLDLDDQSSVTGAGVSWPWPDWSWFDVAIDMSEYAGETVQIAFHHEKEFVPTGGGSFGITNIGIWEDIENDVQLLEMDMPNYKVVNNEVEIGGTIKNIGSNNVTSIEGEYLINGEVAMTFEVTGVNIPPFQNYSFTAGDPANFTSVDIFEVELVITKVNEMDDSSPENNILTQVISIASEVVDRKPLFEMFTSSTCGPCVDGNEVLDGVLANNEASTYSLVKNQVDWPGNGDPYYNEDCGVRVDYYGVGGVPHLITNGRNWFSSYEFTQAKFNQAAAEEAYVYISMEHEFDGLYVDVALEVDPRINITDASVHFAVVEKITYNNTGTNGETEFQNVMMAMLPDGFGTSTALVEGTTSTFYGNTDLITTFIEEYDDLMLVSWVQDNNTKSVLQSESYDLTLTTNIAEAGDKENVSIFPNPGTGIFTLSGVEKSRVEITDINGKIIAAEFAGKEHHTMDLSALDAGVYLVRITRDNALIAIEKLLIY